MAKTQKKIATKKGFILKHLDRHGAVLDVTGPYPTREMAEQRLVDLLAEAKARPRKLKIRSGAVEYRTTVEFGAVTRAAYLGTNPMPTSLVVFGDTIKHDVGIGWIDRGPDDGKTVIAVDGL